MVTSRTVFPSVLNESRPVNAPFGSTSSLPQYLTLSRLSVSPIRRPENIRIPFGARTCPMLPAAAETSAASDIADGLNSTDESTRERLHIFREEPGFAEEMDDTAFAKSEPLEYTTIADILCAAEQGDPEAQDWLGHNYYCGANGLEKNYEEAAYWYHKSAEQGSEAGMHHLAQFYKLTEQYKMAVEWYRKYAELRIRQRREYLGW